MKLIIGLGNPWDKYKQTRHNIWFKIVEKFVEADQLWQFSYNNKFGAEVLETKIGRVKLINILLAKKKGRPDPIAAKEAIIATLCDTFGLYRP